MRSILTRTRTTTRTTTTTLRYSSRLLSCGCTGPTVHAKPLELTLAILKPHLCANPCSVQEIRERILEKQFYFINSKELHLSWQQAEQFYLEHKGKFFYHRLVSSMSSGRISVHILAREDAITRWRALMGPTKVYRTRYEAPETIRGQFGESDTRNATHGSDSPSSAHREIQFFFPEFNFDLWHEKIEPMLRLSANRVSFDPSQWRHSIPSYSLLHQ